MNWLAHLALSHADTDYQLGCLLADPLRGRSWQEAPTAFTQGMQWHARMDGFTDSHTYFKKSKSRLRDKGYLKGVVIDVVYDYFVTVHWDRYFSWPLEEFVADFYVRTEKTLEVYPDRPREIMRPIIHHDVLRSYGTIMGVKQALGRIDYRLSERILKKENASGYLPEITRELDYIEEDFFVFFTDLIEFYFKQNPTVGDWVIKRP